MDPESGGMRWWGCPAEAARSLPGHGGRGVLREEAHRHARAVAASERAGVGQAFVDSVTICPSSTDPTEAPPFRLSIPWSTRRGSAPRS